MIRRVALVLVAGAALATVAAAPAAAHPMGNFTINTATALQIATDHITVLYAVDMAEIPTVQAQQTIDTNGDGKSDDAEQLVYRNQECGRIAVALHVAVDDRPVPLTATDSSLAFVPGLAGLSTMRLDCRLTAPIQLADSDQTIRFDDTYTNGRIGWHEVTAVGDGARLVGSDVPTDSPSAGLTNYPKNRIQSPPDIRHAQFRAVAGGPRLATAAGPAQSPLTHSTVPGVDRATRAFSGLITSRDLTVRVGLVAMIVAFVLGAFHAVAPGHGKTVMAAYLVGQRGTLRQALGVGASVTLTHTAGVLVLGTMLSVSTLVAPERLYPWLGAFSGLFLASIGAALLLRAARLRRRGVTAIWHGHDHPLPDPEGGRSQHRAAETVLAHAATGSPPTRLVAHPVDAPAVVGVAAHSHSRDAGHTHVHDGGHTHVYDAGYVDGADGHGHTRSAGHGHSHGDHMHATRVVHRELGGGSLPVEDGAYDGHRSPNARADSQTHGDDRPLSWRWIVAMGFAGGMVPSPSALVVLLGAIALGRTWFGVSLVIAYGAGMAATLVAAGLLLVRARSRIEALVETERGRRAARILQVLPVVTSLAIIGGGLFIAGRAIKAF